MKFLCVKAFEHSGVTSYRAGKLCELTAAQAAQLVKLKKNKDDAAGALKFFKPVDDEAKKFVADKTGGVPKTEVKP
jgi:hypothetical protein